MKRYLKDSSFTFGTQLIILLTAIGANIIIARVLGPSGKGILTIISLFPFFIALTLGFGIDEANIYLLGSKKFSHKKVFSNSLYIGLLMSIISIIVLFYFRVTILSKFLKNLDSQYFFLSLLIIPFFLLWRFNTSILRGHSDFFKFNLLEIARSILYFLLCAIFILILKIGVAGGVFALLLSMSGIVIISIIILWERGKSFCKPDFFLLRKSLNYGVRAQPGVVMSFFNKRLDMFIVNFFLNPAQVGYYAISVSLAELLWHIPNAFAITLFTKIAGLKIGEANEFTSRIVRNITFIMFISGCILALFAKPLVYMIFGPKFAPSIRPLWFLLPGVLSLGITKLICADFHGRGKPQYGTYLTSISVFFTVVLDFILIPRFGIIGAAVASSIAYCVACFFAIWLFKREAKLPLHDFLIIRRNELNIYPRVFKSLFKLRQKLPLNFK